MMSPPLHLDDEALARIQGAGQFVYNTLNKVMPHVDSNWGSMSCIERASTFGMYGNLVSAGFGIAAGASALGTVTAPAAPILGAGGIVTGAATSVAGTQYLKECNAVEGKK